MSEERVLSIYTPDIDPYSGYGRMSLELLYRVSMKGYHVNVMGEDWHTFDKSLSPAVKELLEKPIRTTLGGFALGYPTLIEQYGPLLANGPMVAATMFESTKLPDGWAAALNKSKAVAVPAKFLVKVFRDSGVHVPIHIVPIGVSETFHLVEREWPDVFTFLCIGDRGWRKGWDVAAQAFAKAFGKSDKHKLIIKCREEGLEGIEKFSNPNIEILRGDFSEAELQKLYARCDAMVYPTRGEGFGLPPREFAATGGPVIATNWGGTADDLPAWGYPLKYTLDKAWKGHPQMDGLGKWAEPNVEHLVKQMQHVASEKRFELWARGHKTPKGLRMEAQSERVAMKIRKLYSWEKFAEGMLGLWEKYSQPAPAPVSDSRKRRKKGGSQTTPLQAV